MYGKERAFVCKISFASGECLGRNIVSIMEADVFKAQFEIRVALQRV